MRSRLPPYLTVPRALSLLLAVLLPACAGTPKQPVAPPAPLPPRLHAPLATDPVPLGLDAEGVVALCESHLRRAADDLAAVKWQASVGEPTWETTLGPIDDLSYEIGLGAGMSELMSVGHPDAAVREAAKACRPKVDKFYTEMMLDAELAAAVERYAASKPQLEGTRARLLRELRRDFRRNGLGLPEATQAQLRALNERITALEQAFETNLSEARGTIQVTPAQLAGTPEAFVAAHPPGPDGLVTLSTDYPDYFPVLTYADDREVAKRLNFAFDNRAADKNVKLLEEVLTLRTQKAKLLGYATWADYVLEARMAGGGEAVQRFLDGVKDTVAAPAAAEYARYAAAHAALGKATDAAGKGPSDRPGATRGGIPNYDRMYLAQRLRQQDYQFDDKLLSEYFEVGKVTDGLLDIVSRLFGVRFVDRPDAPRWFAGVRALDVVEGEGEATRTLARIYLDLHPREGKYKHAAMFGLRDGKRLADGSYVTPIAALMCNFPATTDAAPGLLTHDQVQTFFHEFGHALHHALTQEALASFSGTNTVRDFVEAPSQLLEEWAWDRETLDLFARHHRSGETIPDALFTAMTRARAFGRAVDTERQLSLAALDIAYHSRPTPLDTDAVRAEVMSETQRFGFQPDTHFQGTFGHLMGYDAGYYGYQWALALAQDMLTRFRSEGMLNREVAGAYRRAILERGAGPDEKALVEGFLGRPTNLEAYGRFLSAGAADLGLDGGQSTDASAPARK